MASVEPLDEVLDLLQGARFLPQMEQDLRGRLVGRKMRVHIQLSVPREIYAARVQDMPAADQNITQWSYPLKAENIALGRLVVWSYHQQTVDEREELETYLLPWMLAYRRRLMEEIYTKGYFAKQQARGDAEIDFFKRRVNREIERAKRYNVFVTYFSAQLDGPGTAYTEKVAGAMNRFLQAFEPAILLLERKRIDFLKVGMPQKAAERFVPQVEQALNSARCTVKDIRMHSFPKDFFEGEELFEQAAL